MDVDNLPQSKTGLEFFQNVYRRLEQGLMKKLPTGYRFTYGSDRWITNFPLQDGNTSVLLRHYNIDQKNRKNTPYFAMNLKLPESMGWVIPLTSSTYDISPIYCWNFSLASRSPDVIQPIVKILY